MDMFSLGLLVGLVAGAWLTVIYYVVVTHLADRRALFRRADGTSVHRTTRSVLQTTPARPIETTSPSSLHEQPKSIPLFDPENLSSTSTELYHELVMLVHDQKTAQRLIGHELKQRPDCDIETAISHAIAYLVRDRRV